MGGKEMRHLIKKLLREGLLGESEMKTAQEVGLSDKTFYHGTTIKIDKLDPEFRQNNPEVMKSKDKTGSSERGVGIYFSPQLGFDPNNVTYADNGDIIMTQRGENALKWAKDGWEKETGYIYEMKLKPGANIIDDRFDKVDFNVDERDININQYKELIKLNVDAVWANHELVVLNPNAVLSFKLIYKLVTKYQVGFRLKRGRPDIDKESLKVLDKDNVVPYLKELLGNEYSDLSNTFKIPYTQTYSNGDKIAYVKKIRQIISM